MVSQENLVRTPQFDPERSEGDGIAKRLPPAGPKQPQVAPVNLSGRAIRKRTRKGPFLYGECCYWAVSACAINLLANRFSLPPPVTPLR